MKHLNRLSLSWRETFQNPSLIGVGVAQLILLFLLGVMFGLLVTDFFSTPGNNILILMIYVTVFPLLISVVAGIFAAGFYFMVKNVTQDGSTTIREFIPGVKRYWGRCVVLYLVKNFIIPMILFVPVAIFFFTNVSGGVSLINPIYFLVTFGIAFLIYSLINFFWLLWAVPLVVYEDKSAVESIKGSFNMANHNFSQMAVILLLSGLVFLAYFILQEIVNYLFVMLASEPTTGAIVVRVLLDVILPVIGIVVLVLISLFIFHSYLNLLGKKASVSKRQVKSRRKKQAR